MNKPYYGIVEGVDYDDLIRKEVRKIKREPVSIYHLTVALAIFFFFLPFTLLMQYNNVNDFISIVSTRLWWERMENRRKRLGLKPLLQVIPEEQ